MRKRKILLIGGGVFLSLCIGFVILAALIPSDEVDTSSSRSEEVAVEIEDDEGPQDEADDSPQPTRTPVPSDTPEPTDTVAPTHTATAAATNTSHATNTPRPSATPTPVPQVQVVSNSVNLRTGPGTEYETVSVAVAGDTYEVIAKNSDGSWYNVRLEDGTRAWIAVSVIEAVDAASLASVRTAATIPAPPVVQVIPTQPPATQVPVATATTVATAVPAATAEPTQPPATAPGQVVIIGVNKSAEYVDIQNIGGSPQDLSGWVLVSEKGNQACTLGGTIQPNEVLRIWALAEDAGQGGYNCGFGSNIWNNSESDPAVLYNAQGVEVSRR